MPPTPSPIPHAQEPLSERAVESLSHAGHRRTSSILDDPGEALFHVSPFEVRSRRFHLADVFVGQPGRYILSPNCRRVRDVCRPWQTGFCSGQGVPSVSASMAGTEGQSSGRHQGIDPHLCFLIRRLIHQNDTHCAVPAVYRRARLVLSGLGCLPPRHPSWSASLSPLQDDVNLILIVTFFTPFYV